MRAALRVVNVVPGVGDAACVADDSYARHGVAVSVRGFRDRLPLLYICR